MDYKLDINNFTDIYIDKTLKNNNNIIKHEFNIKPLLKNPKEYIQFDYSSNTILIFNKHNIKLYYQYSHVKKKIYNNEILILETNVLLKIYQDNGNDNINDYELNNLIIYEIKNTNKLNFTLKQSNHEYINSNIDTYFLNNDKKIDRDKIYIYNLDDDTKYEIRENFIEICDRGYSHLIYKFIINTNIDIKDKFIKIKSFEIIFYYQVKKICKKIYELTLVKFYNDIDNDYIECNFDNMYDTTFIDKIKYYIDKIENCCDKLIETFNITRPLKWYNNFLWYYNFNDILKKYKIYNTVVFFNLSWYNKYSRKN